MDQPTDRTQLEFDKLSTEIEKLREDVAKTRQDRGLYNRHLPALGPLLGVLATFVVGYVTFELGRSQQEAAQRLREREDERQATESGLRLAQFALANRTEFLEGSPEAQQRFVSLVTELLDPEPRAKLLAGLKLIATQAPVLDRIGQAQQTLPGRAPAQPAGAQDARLLLYPHIVRAQDRDEVHRVLGRARELARERNLPALIEHGNIEVVATGAPQQGVEIRIYYEDQRAAAEQAALLLREAAQQEGVGRFSDVTVKYIGDRYGNLPRGRAEVWFPPLAQAAR